MSAHFVLICGLMAVVARASSPLPVSAFDVSWDAPTPELANATTSADGMPAGNGIVVALAWGNATTGGLDFFVRSPLAMATDSTLLTIARVSVWLSPNPCAPSGSYWNQTHHAADGSISLLCGGTSAADYVAGLTLFIDANAPVIIVNVAARDVATLFTISVALEPIRPRPARGPAVASWQDHYHCQPSQTTTDEVPAAGLAPLPPGGIAVYHTNSLAAGDTPFFHDQMRQQGLASLTGQFPDPLDGRMFGVLVTGAAGADGAGVGLVATSNFTLASAAPSSAFVVRVDVRIDPAAQADAAAFLAALAVQSAAGPAPAARAAASAAWWSTWWARSYIVAPDALLTAQYARTRFVQAVQSRGHAVPIKFNGQLWASSRQWGADHCECERGRGCCCCTLAA